MFQHISHPLIATASWQPLSLGSSNALFRASVNNQSYVLRLNADVKFAFGVDRAREGLVLELVGHQPWAPTIIENNVSQGWCLMLDHGSAFDESVSAGDGVLKSISQLQSFSKSVSLKTQQDIVFNHAALFLRYKQAFSDKLSALNNIANNQLALQLCDLLDMQLHKFPKVESVLMHQDLHQQNVCANDQHSQMTTLIDWEYAGWGSPWLDAASLYSEFSIKPSEINALPSFSQLSLETVNIGIKQAAAFNQAIASIWYWFRFLLQDESLLETQSRHQLFEQLTLSVDTLLKALAIARVKD